MRFGEDRDMRLQCTVIALRPADKRFRVGADKIYFSSPDPKAPHYQSATNMFSGKPDGHNTGTVTWYRIKLRQRESTQIIIHGAYDDVESVREIRNHRINSNTIRS
jgi:hypothetical protein